MPASVRYTLLLLPYSFPSLFLLRRAHAVAALALYYLSYWPVWVEVRVHSWFAFYSFYFLYTYSSSVVLIVNASLLVRTRDICGCCNLRRFIVHRVWRYSYVRSMSGRLLYSVLADQYHQVLVYE